VKSQSRPPFAKVCQTSLYMVLYVTIFADRRRPDVFQVAVVGTSECGKSSIITTHFAGAKFCTDYDPTIEDAYPRGSVLCDQR